MNLQWQCGDTSILKCRPHQFSSSPTTGGWNGNFAKRFDPFIIRFGPERRLIVSVQSFSNRLDRKQSRPPKEHWFGKEILCISHVYKDGPSNLKQCYTRATGVMRAVLYNTNTVFSFPNTLIALLRIVERVWFWWEQLKFRFKENKHHTTITQDQ